MSQTPWGHALRAVCAGAFLFAAGCGHSGPERGAVSGEVTLDGQPLEQGSILFAPVDGTKGVVTGGPITGGKYSLSGEDGPTVGTNRVEIRAVKKTGKMVPKPLAPPGEMTELIIEAIPPRFNSASTLKTEIKPGQNKADFKVESK